MTNIRGTNALIQSLKSGHLGSAGLDVYEEALGNIAQTTLKNITDYENKQILTNEVSSEKHLKK